MQGAGERETWIPGPGQSMWTLMSERVPGSEVSKIRAALGENLVDLYTEAHSEAERWHKIWQGIQHGKGGLHGNRAGTPLQRLPDPPAIKELVRAEIGMLLRSIQGRAASHGRDGQEVLSRYKRETVKYALGGLSSALPDRGDTNASQYSSRSSSCCSARSSAEDDIQAAHDKLNVTNIDEVADHLRSILTEECEVLKRQVKHMQEDIKKRKSNFEVLESEPSLSELKDLRGAIQMDLEQYPSILSSPSSPHSPLSIKNRFGLSSDPNAPNKTLQSFTPVPVHRPHPPPLCYTQPHPPAGGPKTSPSVRKISSNSTLTTGNQHGSTTGSTEANQIHQLNPAWCEDRHLATSLSGHSPEQESYQKSLKIQSKSPILRTHPSKPCKAIEQNTDCVLSPQTETKCRLLCLSKSASIISSPSLASSSHFNASGSSSHNRSDSIVTTTVTAQDQNEPQWSSGSSLVTVHIPNERWNGTSGGGCTGVIEKHSPVAYMEGSLAQNGSMKIDTGMNRDKNSHPEKDVVQQNNPRGKSLANQHQRQRQATSVTPAFKPIMDSSLFRSKDHLEVLEVIQ